MQNLDAQDTGSALMAQRTLRDEDGRLFPVIEFDNGWTMSLQGDKAGYACEPRQKLEALQDYRTLEVMISAPSLTPVDPARLGLPATVLEKFTPTSQDGPHLGLYMNWADIAALSEAVSLASKQPLDLHGVYILSGSGPEGAWMEPHPSRQAAIVRTGQLLSIDHNRPEADHDQFWETAAIAAAESGMTLHLAKLDPETLASETVWSHPAKPEIDCLEPSA
ncbi:hypothetical protein [Leisingera caerulea]|uniref:hypothetical protein n=1 Tax=Leisingera caerulea TaxID=506591 RepID=UPI0003FA39F5|nr:hypothetical protein [Leisingera caerulea]